MSSDNASYATSISSYSNGLSWGIPLVNSGELPKMDPYEEVAQQGQAPPLLLAYVHDPMKLDEHVPVYVLEPVVPWAAMICMRDDIPEEDMPPQRRFDQGLICSPGHDARTIARVADRAEDVGYAQVRRQESEDFYTQLLDALDGPQALLHDLRHWRSHESYGCGQRHER
ncbi:hypothetical protein Tco_0503245 [Tanacetum coccineum]